MFSLHRLKQYNLSALAISHPWWIFALFSLFLALGLFGLSKLPMTRYPHVFIPIIQVSIDHGSQDLDALEERGVVPLEKALLAVEGVRHVYTALTLENARITVEFYGSEDPKTALLAVKGVVDPFIKKQGSSVFEAGAVRVDFAEVMAPVHAVYGVFSPGRSIEEVTDWVDRELAPQVRALEEVQALERVGGVERRLDIVVTPEDLAKKGVLILDLVAHLKAQAGRSFDDLSALKALPVGLGASLGEVARVEIRRIPTGLSLLDGREVVGLEISPKKGVSDVVFSQKVQGVVDGVKARFPDIYLEKIDSPEGYTWGNVVSAFHTLFEGALLTILVVFVFLRSWRATLIAAITLPLSIIPTFFGMYLLGFSLNLVSLLGIVIVTGILVDDAIVEIENIARYREKGKSLREATLEATRDIGPAIIAISLSIIAVFVPVSFMGGIAGRFFTHFGLTISLAVFFSLLVARLVTPVLAIFLLEESVKKPDNTRSATRLYGRILGCSVRHPWTTVGLGLGFFMSALVVVLAVPQGFLPAEDTSRIAMTVTVPETEKSQEFALKATEKIQSYGGVESVFVTSAPAMEPLSGRPLSFLIRLKDRSARTQSQEDLMARLRTDFEKGFGYEVSFVNDLSGQRDVSVALLSHLEQEDRLGEVAGEVRGALSRLGVLQGVQARVFEEKSLPFFHPYDQKASQSRGDAQAVFEMAMAGKQLPSLSLSGGGDVPVLLRVGMEGETVNFKDVLGLLVRDQTGKPISLGELGKPIVTPTPLVITRFDAHRMVAFEADLRAGASLGEAVSAIEKEVTLPPGFSLVQTGDFETMEETFESFKMALTFGLLCVFVLLVLLLGRVRHSLVVLASLPLSLSGAFWALFLGGLAFTMPVIIGMLMLVGIVAKNAIMLVDHLSQAMERGEAVEDAAFEASVVRLRPIVMTSVAMVAGLIPGALALGAGGEFRSPMAIAVIGGLVVSTVLSLFFVPAFSILVWRKTGFFRSFFRK